MRRLVPALCLALAAGLPAGLQGDGPRAADDAAIFHVLNRLSFGPRPGDVEAVRAIGLERWIERQLHPEKIDESALDERLGKLETHGLSTTWARRSRPSTSISARAATTWCS